MEGLLSSEDKFFYNSFVLKIKGKPMSQKERTVRILTIGYAGKSARRFFTILKEAGVRKVIDVRLYNTSQLAGYTKRDDLEYFLRAIIGADYQHQPVMAPTKQLLDGYKKGLIDWEKYETQFKSIIAQRKIEKYIAPQDADMACFLCAEPTAENCHRRLLAEYLAGQWQNISIKHL
jgi:uncharacterized protein (DUF488 family)